LPYFSSEPIDGQDVLVPYWPAINSLVAQYFPT
jgi:hypothetical protein